MMSSHNNTIEINLTGMENSNYTPVTKHKDLVFSKIDEDTKREPQEIIPNCLKNLGKQNLQFPVLVYKSDSKKSFDVIIRMSQYLELINNAARSFIKIGLEAKASVGIMGFNHAAWFISELGAISAGGIACGIYTTNSADICKFIMNDCNCQIVVVENDDQMQKILSILPELPHLKAIIKYTGTLSEEIKNKYSTPIYTWNEFLNIESGDVITELDKRLENMKPNDCALLIYTSGTTGLPKGVILTHDNLIFTAKMAMEHVGLQPFKHTLISYLPLSHIAANVFDIISTVAIGVTVYFAQPDALKGSLGTTLKEVRPTIFFGVPRIFEKIQEQMQEVGSNMSGIKKFISNWAKQVGYRNSKAKISGKKTDLCYPLAKFLVYDKVRETLGLNNCIFLASAAAPLTLNTLNYFLSLDIVIHQVYGMSESTGPCTIENIDKIKIGSTGTVMKGTELKIADPDENNIGEICMRSRSVFKGYYNNVEKTNEAIDSDGWLHSGDLGKMVNNEFLMITGRIKELIITAGGENIAPVPIEDKIKERLPFVSNVMLVGDKQKFVSCLLTLKTTTDPETQFPTDILAPPAVRSFNEIGIQANTLQQILEFPSVILKNYIDKAIEEVNAQSVSRAAYVQKWSILSRDFSIIGGELGPTMKMKRMVILEMNSSIIKSMYAD